jgi:hypothetical protein
VLYLLSAESGVLTDIRHPDICHNAGFTLDQPLTIGDTEVYFEELMGQWFLIEWTKDGRKALPVGGRWTTNN